MTTNVLILNGGDDTGSIAIRIKQAFDRHAPDWNIRCVRRTNNYANHDADLTWDSPILNDVYTKADIIHFMERVEDPFAGTSKPVVIHHHGEIYRDETNVLAQHARNLKAVEIVSTIDLLSVAPGTATWLPAAYNLEELAGYWEPQDRTGKVIFHSPTYRERKGTEYLVAAVEALKRQWPVTLEVAMYHDQRYIFERKGKADIVFDNLYGYGLNAIEAFGMGVPVVGGLVPSRWAPESVRDDIAEHIGYLPFYEVTEETLADGLEMMIRDEGIRKVWRNIGLEYAYEFHDERKVVKKLQAIYQEAREARS